MIKNFKDLVISDIDGTNLNKDNVWTKEFARIVYNNALNIDLVSIALDMYKGTDIDINDTSKALIESFVDNERYTIRGFAKKAIKDFLNN